MKSKKMFLIQYFELPLALAKGFFFLNLLALAKSIRNLFCPIKLMSKTIENSKSLYYF